MSIVSLLEAKAHLNVAGNTDDALITAKIAAAEAFVDRWLPEPMAEMESVPADMREAVLQLIAHLYENREATLVGVSADELPFGFWDIINQHRAFSF